MENKSIKKQNGLTQMPENIEQSQNTVEMLHLGKYKSNTAVKVLIEPHSNEQERSEHSKMIFICGKLVIHI